MTGFCENHGCSQPAVSYTEDGQALCEHHMVVASLVDKAGNEVMAAVSACIDAVSEALEAGIALPFPIVATHTELMQRRRAYLQAVNIMACVELAS